MTFADPSSQFGTSPATSGLATTPLSQAPSSGFLSGGVQPMQPS